MEIVENRYAADLTMENQVRVTLGFRIEGERFRTDGDCDTFCV